MLLVQPASHCLSLFFDIERRRIIPSIVSQNFSLIHPFDFAYPKPDYDKKTAIITKIRKRLLLGVAEASLSFLFLNTMMSFSRCVLVLSSPMRNNYTMIKS